MITALLLASTLVAQPSGSQAEETERFLRKARIVSEVKVGQGISDSSRVELAQGDRRQRALFKTAHQRLSFEFRFGAETAPRYRDSYKHEIAAYEFDKLIGLGVVPPVVERKIGGERGSLQLWIEDVWMRFVYTDRPPPDPQRADEHVHVVRLLDYLIFNTDRHFRNLMFGPDWRPIVIDHSIAFHAMTVPSRPLYRFPRQPIERLRALDQRQLKRALKRYLEKVQIRALERRREIVLGLVDQAVEREGPEATLFDWPRDRQGTGGQVSVR